MFDNLKRTANLREAFPTPDSVIDVSFTRLAVDSKLGRLCDLKRSAKAWDFTIARKYIDFVSYLYAISAVTTLTVIILAISILTDMFYASYVGTIFGDSTCQSNSTSYLLFAGGARYVGDIRPTNIILKFTGDIDTRFGMSSPKQRLLPVELLALYGPEFLKVIRMSSRRSIRPPAGHIAHVEARLVTLSQWTIAMPMYLDRKLEKDSIWIICTETQMYADLPSHYSSWPQALIGRRDIACSADR
ncbi:hypothetical protein J1614_011550 [Plenodomus biglobosus]|nr:hypothetical protein J1614_011550 [Plenodomus biglobosus]